MNETSISFASGDLSLEGIYTEPEGEGPLAGVVVCHPHPLYGGMMDNNIVIAVSRALSRVGIGCLRFNFRGVGESEGKHDNGIGEQDDVTAALQWLAARPLVGSGRIGLCGYSFGAVVALEAAARIERETPLALVSLILSPDSPLGCQRGPKLLLWGSQDLALPAADLQSLMQDLPDSTRYQVVTGADHFWWGYEDTVGDAVAAFFSDKL
jgi:alpha/beta superfamily hydrolase